MSDTTRGTSAKSLHQLPLLYNAFKWQEAGISTYLPSKCSKCVLSSPVFHFQTLNGGRCGCQDFDATVPWVCPASFSPFAEVIYIYICFVRLCVADRIPRLLTCCGRQFHMLSRAQVMTDDTQDPLNARQGQRPLPHSVSFVRLVVQP